MIAIAARTVSNIMARAMTIFGAPGYVARAR